MLQQTRVAAVIPYYERFLARFPDPSSLAQAPETEVLALWGGLGYYSRARNLHKAAQRIAAQRSFPRDYASIRALPGVGDYTAAAIASIAFGLPHAVVDGNVRRVAARLANDARADVQAIAEGLLDRRHPGRSNQALMELGALVCLPRDPRCAGCPVSAHCEAYRHGAQASLPPPRIKPATVRLALTLLLIRRGEKVLLVSSPRVQGFWDLPEPGPQALAGERLGLFRHAILNRQYTLEVCQGIIRRRLPGSLWCSVGDLKKIPLSTTAKKALRCLDK